MTQQPDSAGVSDLATRRQRVLADRAARKRTENIERLMDDLADAVAADHVAAAITASKRSHPSNGRVYDREAEA
jgi:hypothetical protein